MNIQKLNIKDLIPAEYNPRQSNKKQEEQLKKSLEKFGVVEPVIVNKNSNRENIIIGGHFRVRELKKLGYKEVDCVTVDLSLEDEKELNIRLNKNTGEWDWDVLSNNFDIGDLKEWGFEESEFGFDDEGEGGSRIEEDEIIKIKEKPFVKKCDIWEMNEHRLMCGDSTLDNDVAKLMNGQKAVLAHNDPPYGMKKEGKGVINDNLNYDDLLKFNNEWVTLQFTYLLDNASWYCWGIDEPLMDIYSNIIKPFIKDNKATFRNLITWNKGFAQGQLSNLMRSYPRVDEKCLFVMCGVQGFNTNKDNYFDGWESVRDYLLQSRLAMGWDVPTMKRIVGHSHSYTDHWTSKSQFYFPTREVYNNMKKEADRLRESTKNDAFKKEYDELKKEYDSTRGYFNNTHDIINNIWNFTKTNNKERSDAGGHATPKPLELCARVINTSSRKGDLVVDFFLGSGSTLIACEQLNRKCFAMELDENYCSVSIMRWLRYMNKEKKEVSLKCNNQEIDYKDLLEKF